MASAIELYRQAYELDYRQGDWELAEEMYKRIVDEHPHSDEAEYAQVHLERIGKLKGNPDMPEISSSRGGYSAAAFGIISFVLILLLFVAVGFGGFYTYQLYLRQQRTDLILQGLLSERSGQPADALERYREARVLVSDDVVGARYLAEMYLKRGEYGLANVEMKLWELSSPDDPAIPLFQRRLEKAKSAEARKKVRRR